MPKVGMQPIRRSQLIHATLEAVSYTHLSAAEGRLHLHGVGMRTGSRRSENGIRWSPAKTTMIECDTAGTECDPACTGCDPPCRRRMRPVS